MKDIDFDELDRAVSSVLEPVTDPTPTAPAVGATAPVPQPAATSPAAPAPETAPTAPAAVPTTPAPAESAAPAASVAKMPLAIKRRGQFMDVVHPSSDMTNKSEETVATPPRKITLQPLSASVEPEADPTSSEVEKTPESEPAPAVVAETLVVPQSSVETVEPTPAEHAMPDPLDVMQAHEEANDAANAETATVEDVQVSPADTTEEVPPETEAEAVPATPFLADTQVEKRPLDAFSVDEAEEAPAEPASEQTEAVEPLPPELQADVIAVEANPSDHADQVAEQETAADEKKETGETGFNTSIAQQYASAENKADEDHSIFDTSEYHQPIALVKAKKRGLPGWLAALLIMILLAALSAAGGYFWFYYGL